MFWRMTGLSTASPVETILDKDDYTLEELLDEDEIIQECKALNSRLINFLRETTQVEQLLRYIVEEPPLDAEKKRTFKFPFIACEIFTCEVDVILRTLVENEELMNLLFSFIMPDHSHSTLLAGYFSKVVVCLMLRKTVSFINFVQAHKEIIHQLVDLIGITSIMEVLIRLIGADEHMYSNYMEAIPWLDDMNILEMIGDKFSSSDSPEVHANAAEILCAITRYAPPALAAKISSPSFVGRLFRHALEESRPKYVLVHSLTVCISLLDSKRLVSASYNAYRSPPSHGSIIVNPEMVESMLESLGDLLKLLETPRSPSDSTLSTTYGSLRPPLGKHRLKIVEFISVLSNVGSETAGKELIRLGVLRRILDLFLEYPFNNFLHHHVENILISCLESKQSLVTEHLLEDCDLVGKILAAEKNVMLLPDGPTVPAEGKSLPRIGSIGHITRIANKLVQLGNSNSVIQKHLQGNSEWIDWHTNVLLKRNATESVYQWVCGRPAALQDRTRDSDDDDLRDRDYDIAMPDVYFGGESAEVVISSLCLGDDEEDSSSLITNSNWFAFEGNRFANEQPTNSFAPSPSADEADEVILGEGEELDGTTARSQATDSGHSEEPESAVLVNGPIEESKEQTKFLSTISEFEKPREWVEWRETSDKADVSVPQPGAVIPNGDISGHVDLNEEQAIKVATNPFCSDTENRNNNEGKLNEEAGCSPDLPAVALVNNPKPVENKDLGMHLEQGSSSADAEIKANQEAKEVAQVEKEATENN